MKILKVRRGYTTNSSAASEFIPPDAQVAPGKVPGGTASVVAPKALPTAAGSNTPSAAPPPVSGPETPTPTVAAPPGPTRGSSNMKLIGGFAALVALVFVAEKALRRGYRALRRRDDEEA